MMEVSIRNEYQHSVYQKVSADNSQRHSFCVKLWSECEPCENVSSTVQTSEESQARTERRDWNQEAGYKLFISKQFVLITTFLS